MDVVTLDMIYAELRNIKKKINIVENAIIPTKELDQKELDEHKKDLKEAMDEKRSNFRDL